jgi:hypothetical protein
MLTGQTKDNWHHTKGHINGSLWESHLHWSRIYHCDFIRSISPARFCRSISSARSRSLHRISSPARSLPSIDLIFHSICSPDQLRSTLGLGPHLILSPARLTASLPAHAKVFSICFSVSQPDRHTDARADDTRSPPRCHKICAPLPPYRAAASVSSLRRHLRRRLPRPRCAAHSTHPAKRRSVVVNPPNLQHEW